MANTARKPKTSNKGTAKPPASARTLPIPGTETAPPGASLALPGFGALVSPKLPRNGLRPPRQRPGYPPRTELIPTEARCVGAPLRCALSLQPREAPEEDVRPVRPDWGVLVELLEGARSRGYAADSLAYLEGAVALAYAKGVRAGQQVQARDHGPREGESPSGAGICLSPSPTAPGVDPSPAMDPSELRSREIAPDADSEKQAQNEDSESRRTRRPSLEAQVETDRDSSQASPRGGTRGPSVEENRARWQEKIARGAQRVSRKSSPK